ncbi:MAG TPA: alkaline phosphatase family protein, partial [Actinomycetota bacterium]|nr:alkaline phosphatase family protein [Actinomycetota bacterium]
PLRAVVLVMVVAALGLACDGEPTPTGAPPGAPTVDAMLRTLGRDVTTAVARGYVPGRSGEVLLVPAPWNVLGQWNDGLRAEDDPRTTHATPWAYHQRVPIVLYGPGHVRSGFTSDRSVDVADLAPTFAELLGHPFEAPAGRPLRDALVPTADRAEPPRLIVLVAYDGGGWNVLDRWPDAWPELARVARAGAVYTNGTVGSAPSLTAPVHATMGTGGYPRTHGLPENTARLPGGEVSEIFYREADPVLLRGPTVADSWDAANGNRAWVGLLGFESWHLGMMGKGARVPGGDRDVAILWDREEFEFRTNEEAYRFPADLPPVDELDSFLADLDASDGARDGRWRNTDVSGAETFPIPGTPAFVRFQGMVLERLVAGEPMGRDPLTDFLFVEMKSADYAGHIFNMVSDEVGEVLAAQDEMLAGLVRQLDARVGRGRWVLAMTADHGQTPNPAESGGLRIDRIALEADLRAAFGEDVIEAVHPSELYLDVDALADSGFTVEDVARFVGAYRYRDGIPSGTDRDGIPEEVLDRAVFAGAIPGEVVEAMSPADLAALGPGAFPEGDLTTPPADVGAAITR